jgi:hypothetical protein
VTWQQAMQVASTTQQAAAAVPAGLAGRLGALRESVASRTQWHALGSLGRAPAATPASSAVFVDSGSVPAPTAGAVPAAPGCEHATRGGCSQPQGAVSVAEGQNAHARSAHVPPHGSGLEAGGFEAELAAARRLQAPWEALMVARKVLRQAVDALAHDAAAVAHMLQAVQERAQILGWPHRPVVCLGTPHAHEPAASRSKHSGASSPGPSHARGAASGSCSLHELLQVLGP